MIFKSILQINLEYLHLQVTFNLECFHLTENPKSRDLEQKVNPADYVS